MTAVVATRTPPPRRLPAKILALVLNAVLFLICALLLSVLLEWAGIALGLSSAERTTLILHQEIQQLPTDGNTFPGLPPVAHSVAVTLVALQRLTGSPASLGASLRTLGKPMSLASPYIESATASLHIATLRIVVGAYAALTIVPLAVLAFEEGLVRRELRKWGGDHESAFLYHLSKRSIRMWIFLPWLLYLGSPWSIDPTWCFVPCALLSAGLIGATAALWKKTT